MKNYLVIVKEIHMQNVFVKADTKEDAIEKVLDGDGDYDEGTECLETLDMNTWSVKEYSALGGRRNE